MTVVERRCPLRRGRCFHRPAGGPGERLAFMRCRQAPAYNVRRTAGITGHGGLCSRADWPKTCRAGPISHNFHKTARRWGKTGAKAAQHRQNFARNPGGTFTAGLQDAKIMPLRQAAGALDAGQLAAL